MLHTAKFAKGLTVRTPDATTAPAGNVLDLLLARGHWQIVAVELDRAGEGRKRVAAENLHLIRKEGTIALDQPLEDAATAAGAADAPAGSLIASNGICGRELVAGDGKAGTVSAGSIEDLLFDERWQVRYLVVETQPYTPGKAVLVPTELVSLPAAESDGSDGTDGSGALTTDLDQLLIHTAPRYEATHRVAREYEREVLAHYRRDPYWQQRTDGPVSGPSIPSPP